MAGGDGRDLSGRTVVITGASSGIGAVAARRLAECGATVVPVGRSAARTAGVAAGIGAEPLVADFADLAQVRRVAATIQSRYPRLDILINNAGTVVGDRTRTGDGYEAMFQINYLAPFLLTSLLLPRLRETARHSPVRIISTSSVGSRFVRVRLDDLQSERRPWFGGWYAYGVSKLLVALFTRELARRAGAGVTAACVHPGLVDTRFAADHRMAAWFRPIRRALSSAETGARPLVWLATTPIDVNGAYYERFRRRVPHRQVDDPVLAAELWRRTEELLAG